MFRGNEMAETQSYKVLQQGNALTSSLVLSRDIENTIGINVKDYIDLRNTTRRWRDARQLKFAQHVVVLSP